MNKSRLLGAACACVLGLAQSPALWASPVTVTGNNNVHTRASDNGTNSDSFFGTAIPASSTLTASYGNSSSTTNLDYTGDAGGGPISGTFRDGFILGTARGKYLNENTRVELETAWRNNSGENWDSPLGTGQLDGHFNSVSSLLNVVREFGNGRVKPYAGAGVGWTIQDGDFDALGNHYRLDDWRLAYQGILGLNFMQTNNTETVILLLN